MATFVYKIKNTRTGLYSTGGHSPNWTKKGKMWKNIGHVKTHLKSLYRRNGVNDWIIQSFEIREDMVSETPVIDMLQEIDSIENLKNKKIEDERRAREELKRQTLASLTKEQRRALGIYD